MRSDGGWLMVNVSTTIGGRSFEAAIRAESGAGSVFWRDCISMGLSGRDTRDDDYMINAAKYWLFWLIPPYIDGTRSILSRYTGIQMTDLLGTKKVPAVNVAMPSILLYNHASQKKLFTICNL